MKIFSGTANRDFAEKVADYLNCNLAKVKLIDLLMVKSIL